MSDLTDDTEYWLQHFDKKKQQDKLNAEPDVKVYSETEGSSVYEARKTAEAEEAEDRKTPKSSPSSFKNESEKESATSSSSNDTAMWVQRNEEARKEREAKMGAEASSRKTDDQNRSGKGSEKNEETYSNNNKRVSFTKNL